MEDQTIPQLILPLALMVIMLGVGMSLRLSNFSLVLKQPVVIIVGLLLQLGLLPLLGLAVVLWFQLPATLAVGVMILTFAPGGATSNMITFLSRGDTALSVCLTSIGGVITPFTLPLLTMLAIEYGFGESSNIVFPVLPTMIKLLAVGVLPVLIGVLIHHYWPQFCLRIEKLTKLLAGIFLLAVVTALTYENWETLPSLLVSVGPAIFSLVILAMTFGFLVAKAMKLSADHRVTLAVEVGIQNVGLAMLVTVTILQNAEMSVTALVYGILMNIPAFLLILFRNASGLTVYKTESRA